MKLLIVTQKVDKNDPILGFFHRWIGEFAKYCEFVTVICLQEGAHNLPANVRVLSLGKHEGSRLIKKVFYLFRFYSYILRDKSRYDSVFVHMNPIYIVLGGLMWKVMGKKISLWYTHKYVDLKLLIATLLADTIFTASTESFNVRSGKLIVTGHGIDTEFFRPLTEKRFFYQEKAKLAMVGRISSVKRVLEAVQVTKILRDRGIGATLDIIGDAVTETDRAYMFRIKEWISDNGIEESVSWIGQLIPSDILPYLQQSDVVINLTATGSFDKSALEAMSCGTLVASPNASFEGVLKPLGLFVEGDSPADCAIAIERAMKDAKPDAPAILRDWVVLNHSLDTLIPSIVGMISRPDVDTDSNRK